MDQESEAFLVDEQPFYEHLRIVVDRGQAPMRLDKFLMNRVENASRNRIQQAIEAGNVLVNEQAIKSSYKIKPNEIISVVLPTPPRDTEIYPEDIPLDIVYEDDDILLVNKPANMVVHPGYNNYNGTLVNALAHYFEQISLPNREIGRPGLVHRIDKDTSGLLIIAKHEFSLSHLAKQFFDHSISRTYLALVWGDLETSGTVSGFINRSKNDRRVMAIYTSESEGKWSVTHYQIRKRFGYVTLIECRLETGRTHQIRAHMKHIGHPLFNDAVYGGNKILKGTVFNKYRQFVDNCFEVMPRQALHAQSLGFIHPRTAEILHFESPIPKDFDSLIKKWEGYVGHI